MKQIYLYLISIVLFTTCNVSVTPQYHSEVKRHRSVAIMPFVVNIYKLDDVKIVSSHHLEAKERFLSRFFQQQAYVYFNNRKSKTGQIPVAVQQVEETNRKLAELGITHKQVSLFSEKELARFLGVDSFIYGSVDIRNNPNKDQSIHMVSFSNFGGNQEMLAEIDLKLASSVSGSVIWQYKEFGKGYSLEESRNDTILFNTLLNYPLSKIQYKSLN